jgi:hypothetical protein
MTLLFIKRLNDTFEENAEKLIKEGESKLICDSGRTLNIIVIEVLKIK